MAAPDMRIAGDEFFDSTDTFDISVMTTLGLDDESLAILRDVEGVDAVMPAYRADAMVKAGQGSYAAIVESLPDGGATLNRPLLEQGAWPANEGDCVVGFDAAEKLGVGLGDVIAVEKVDGELEDTFARTEFRVSGLVSSPMFISSGQMGTTSLGTGSIELYLYVQESAFDADLPYAVAYLTSRQARDVQWDSEAYDREIESMKQRVEQAADEAGGQRWAAVVGEAQRELDDARADYKSERADAESELADAASELASARNRLDSAASELVTGRVQVDDAAAKIEESEAQLQAAEEEYEKGKSELAAQRKKFKKQAGKLDELKGQRGQLVDGIARNHDVAVFELVFNSGINQFA